MRKIKCDVYSRVTGYIRPVSSYNNGKQEEFKERSSYD
jgi:ribonucleoside-triphosphate reductase (formate)